MRVKVQPHFLGLTPERFRRWTPTVIGFGTTFGITALLFTETIPRIRREILSNVPVVGSYWRNKIEDQK